MCASVCGDALRIEHAIKVTTSPLLTHMFTGITKQQVVVRPSSNEGHKISLSPVVILPRLSPPPPPVFFTFCKASAFVSLRQMRRSQIVPSKVTWKVLVCRYTVFFSLRESVTRLPVRQEASALTGVCHLDHATSPSLLYLRLFGMTYPLDRAA